MQVTKQLESGENPTLANVQYLQQLRDEMSSYSKEQDKVMMTRIVYFSMQWFIDIK